MIPHKGRAALAMLVTTASLLAAAPPASADTAACTFDGIVGTFSPAMPTFGGWGEYSFGGGADCEYVDTTGAGAGTTYSTTAWISSSGGYAGNICAAGTFAGTLNMGFASGTDVTDRPYQIQFVGGNGVLTGPPVAHGAVRVLPAECAAGRIDAFVLSGSISVQTG